MLPVIPQSANNWLSQPNAQAALGAFPANLIGYMDEEKQKAIMTYVSTNYVWPQVMERGPFEKMWDKILEMYRIKLDKVDVNFDETTKAGKDTKDDKANTGKHMRVADSVVFDAVERLTGIHHFVSFKEGMPIQYNIPKYYDTRAEDSFYHPFKDRLKAANALLAWNFDNEEIYRKHAILARHFYLYGICFASSEFSFTVKQSQRMDNFGRTREVPEIVEIGTTFDPISIRKIWFNYRIGASDMEYQPCPFYFDETPRFATVQNQYDPNMNPFGFLNLDKVAADSGPSWLYQGPEMAAQQQAIEGIATLQQYKDQAIPNLLKAEHSVEALWTYYPMLPLDPITLDWMTYPDGTPVPHVRYVMNSFGHNLAGHQIPLRIQRNFYPRDMLPLYGSSHLPDLDSGLYTPSMGYLLWNHYKELVTCKNQYIANKDWINDPPAWVLASSPAVNADLNAAGNKIEVNGPRDFDWRAPYDATQTTVNMMNQLRDQAQTTTKSTDAILGKALGGRTSATEAQNAFQTSMSAVTTPINIFNYDMMGGYAWRVWEYTATWFPPDLLKAITGQMGFVLTPEDLWTRVGLKWDIGSTFIESIVRQGNIRYMLESSMGDPSINRAPMWKELLTQWRFDTAGEWVNDGGFDREVYIATTQAINTFYGKPVVVNPDQNHQIAIKVKTRFLEDQESIFMTQMVHMAPALIQQIQIHEQFHLLEMHQQLLAAQAGMQLNGEGGGMGAMPQQPPLMNGMMPQTGGQVSQLTGGSLN